MSKVIPRNKGYGEALSELAGKLERCPAVTQYDHDAEKEAWTLAHSLLDLKESFEAFLTTQLPKLLDAEPDAETTHRVLLEIGEELRHIAYHIKDPRFFRYLAEQDHPDEAVIKGQ